MQRGAPPSNGRDSHNPVATRGSDARADRRAIGSLCVSEVRAQGSRRHSQPLHKCPRMHHSSHFCISLAVESAPTAGVFSSRCFLQVAVGHRCLLFHVGRCGCSVTQWGGRVFGNRLRQEGAATAGPRCVADWAMQRAQWGGWDGRVGLRGLHTTRATARATEGGHLLARFRKLKRSLKFAPTPAAS